jgi:hypothetical protein
MNLNNIIIYISEYTVPILIVLTLLVLVYTVIFIILLGRTAKIQRKFNRIMKGTSAVSLEEMINSYQTKVDTAEENAALAVDHTRLLSNQIRHCVQKVGVVRFKAFEDVGSDLSYAVALLDDQNDGVVLTSIFGRNSSTSYAKPIEKGISRYTLSDEELYAMNKALGLEKKNRAGKSEKQA